MIGERVAMLIMPSDIVSILIGGIDFSQCVTLIQETCVVSTTSNVADTKLEIQMLYNDGVDDDTMEVYSRDINTLEAVRKIIGKKLQIRVVHEDANGCEMSAIDGMYIISRYKVNFDCPSGDPVTIDIIANKVQ